MLGDSVGLCVRSPGRIFSISGWPLRRREKRPRSLPPRIRTGQSIGGPCGSRFWGSASRPSFWSPPVRGCPSCGASVSESLWECPACGEVWKPPPAILGEDPAKVPGPPLTAPMAVMDDPPDYRLLYYLFAAIAGVICFEIWNGNGFALTPIPHLLPKVQSGWKMQYYPPERRLETDASGTDIKVPPLPPIRIPFLVPCESDLMGPLCACESRRGGGNARCGKCRVTRRSVASVRYCKPPLPLSSWNTQPGSPRQDR